MRGLRNQPGDRSLHFLRLWDQREQITGQVLPSQEPVREYAFHPDRGWRFDVAFLKYRVAVEIEGIARGRRSRHTEPVGYRNDCEKYNEAQFLGWLVVRVTTEDLDKRPQYVIWSVVKGILAQAVREEKSR
jgi:very-short-patch-repair endonuclease